MWTDPALQVLHPDPIELSAMPYLSSEKIMLILLPRGGGRETQVAVEERATAEDFVETPTGAGAATNFNGGAGAGDGDGGAQDIALALEALALTHCCAHCGVQGVDASVALKKCARCMQTWYCGAKCQKEAWRGHKLTCALPVHEVYAKIVSADWRGVLEWEGRMEELLVGTPDETCAFILQRFIHARSLQIAKTGNVEHVLASAHHAFSLAALYERRIELLGKMQLFRDQGEAMCMCATLANTEKKETVRYFQRARDVAEAHGFFTVECKACTGLGELALQDGRYEEAADLLRNALAAVPLMEKEDVQHDVKVLVLLGKTLFMLKALDELEALVPRLRETTKAASQDLGRRALGRLGFGELETRYLLARLHEVLPILTPAHSAALIFQPLQPTAESICHRSQHARAKPAALLDPLPPLAGARATSRGCKGDARSAQICKTERGRL